MINEIHIENVATYIEGVDFNLKKINFIYGANGTGKSTLSKILNKDIDSSSCKIIWNNNLEEEIVVYNRTFVERNFQNDTKLKGIFTLGEDSIEIQNEINSKRKQVEDIGAEIEKNQNSIDKIVKQQEELRCELEKKCWEVQKQYGAEFASALVGFRNKMKIFCNECIQRAKSLDKENISTVEDLRIMYQAAFAKEASKDDVYPNLPIDDIIKLNTNRLLNTIIVGKSDTPIGAFIDYLKASDWVKKGMEYAKKKPGKCPYCQQNLPQNIQNDIEAYFDKKYIDDKNELDTYEKSYSLMSEKVKKVLQEIENKKYSYIDYKEFESKKMLLISKLDSNQRIIQNKIQLLSKPVEIELIDSIANELIELIKNFNKVIEQNNKIVENQSQAKNRCKDKLWNFLVFQCINDIEKFNKEYGGKEKGKKNIIAKKKQKEAKIKSLIKEIETQESTLTSINPTVDAINSLLKSFGFNGFMLAVNAEKIGTYKIIRPSGEDASNTLSEGEHNFITFLYFYHLCFGSQNKTGLYSKKVLVIDDPISSMDNNVLFIVSTLVKTIINKCKNAEQGINQVIILTHNVYFHKEITYGCTKSTQIGYYILRKVEEKTNLQEYDSNPISTSYELLWKEFKNNNIGSASILMNIMRRILEHYFTIIGGIDFEKCIDQFDGSDKIVCKALIAVINEGSHSIFEDLVFSLDDGEVENYKKVFKLVFEKLGHIDHYNMMMSKN